LLGVVDSVYSCSIEVEVLDGHNVGALILVGRCAFQGDEGFLDILKRSVVGVEGLGGGLMGFKFVEVFDILGIRVELAVFFVEAKVFFSGWSRSPRATRRETVEYIFEHSEYPLVSF